MILLWSWLLFTGPEVIFRLWDFKGFKSIISLLPPPHTLTTPCRSIWGWVGNTCWVDFENATLVAVLFLVFWVGGLTAPPHPYLRQSQP